MSEDHERAARIRALNDDFRKEPHDRCMITSGVQSQGLDFTAAAVKAVEKFDTFIAENDPYGEHDFGSLELRGRKLFWKIDYYEKGSNHAFGAGAPENSETTDRVLTIMLADEY